LNNRSHRAGAAKGCREESKRGSGESGQPDGGTNAV
jgi:hypothetical protein